MKLILHIGTTKTGTSTIQSFLDINRAILEEKGFYYSRSLGKTNQPSVSIYSAAYHKTKDLNKRAGAKSESQSSVLKQEIYRSFTEEIHSLVNIHTVIISNEHLYSRCYEDDDFTRLKTLLGDHFSDVQILCYLRPQLDQAISLYSTRLRHGFKLNINGYLQKQIAKTNPYYDFETFLKMWAKHFGLENVSARLFEVTKNLEHGVLDDFIDALDATTLKTGFRYPKRVNESLNSIGQEVLLKNNKMRSISRPNARRFMRDLNNMMTSEFPGNGAVPSFELALNFFKAYHPSNAWIRRTWFPHLKHILEPNWERFEEVSQHGRASPRTHFRLLDFFRIWNGKRNSWVKAPQKIMARLRPNSKSRKPAKERSGRFYFNQDLLHSILAIAQRLNQAEIVLYMLNRAGGYTPKMESSLKTIADFQQTLDTPDGENQDFVEVVLEHIESLPKKRSDVASKLVTFVLEREPGNVRALALNQSLDNRVAEDISRAD